MLAFSSRWLLFPPLLACAGACGHFRNEGENAIASAQAAIAHDQPARAIDLLMPVYARDPENLEVVRLLTEGHAKSGDLDAWIDSLKAQPRPSPATEYGLGLASFAQAADATPEVVAHFERAIEQMPHSQELHLRLGLALVQSEKFAAAQPWLLRAAQLPPPRAAIYLPLALSQARTGQKTQAIASLAQAIALGPSPTEVATARSISQHLHDPFARFPQAARGKLEAGIAALQEYDRPQEAIVDFEELLQDYPDLAVVHALLGLAYQRLDDAGEALDEIKRSIALAPDDPKGYFYLGELYASRQRPVQAFEAYEKAIALDPTDDQAYARLGDLALDRRDLPKAEKAYQTLAILRPDSAEPRIKLSLAIELSGDLPSAERELRTALSKEPTNIDAMLRLGLVLSQASSRATRQAEKTKAAAEASEWFHRVLEIQPDNAVASKALGDQR